MGVFFYWNTAYSECLDVLNVFTYLWRSKICFQCMWVCGSCEMMHVINQLHCVKPPRHEVLGIHITWSTVWVVCVCVDFTVGCGGVVGNHQCDVWNKHGDYRKKSLCSQRSYTTRLFGTKYQEELWGLLKSYAVSMTSLNIMCCLPSFCPYLFFCPYFFFRNEQWKLFLTVIALITKISVRFINWTLWKLVVWNCVSPFTGRS